MNLSLDAFIHDENHRRICHQYHGRYWQKKAIRYVDIAVSKLLLKGGRWKGYLSAYIATVGAH